ncbi:MAG: nucleotidyltransferase domain-containing protein [Eggerthellaceae bacterium]|nr:nucleotidyltransferase domain-containing protein [Eggerthellaceae bacterium]
MDAFDWTRDLAEKLKTEFGERAVFVGLQGSRARGEAHDGSDIDVVVLLDEMKVDDLVRYRSLVESMPNSELACGFVGSADVLALWPRHELFQFYNDTVPIYGELPKVSPFTRDDAMQAARIGASEIYHAACHSIVFDGEAAPGIVKSLLKNAFFVLQALQYARRGVYPRSKAELSKLLDGDDLLVLETGESWDACYPSDGGRLIELSGLLVRWSGSIMRSTTEEQVAVIEESDDILQVSTDDVLPDFEQRMSFPHRRT